MQDGPALARLLPTSPILQCYPPLSLSLSLAQGPERTIYVIPLSLDPKECDFFLLGHGFFPLNNFMCSHHFSNQAFTSVSTEVTRKGLQERVTASK